MRQTHVTGFSVKDNLGLELFFPRIFFCSSFTRFSCSFLILCLSSSIKRCCSTMANLSSACGQTIPSWVAYTALVDDDKRFFDQRPAHTSFFWASSIFLLFSSTILSSSSRFFRSSSYNDNGIYLHEAMMVSLTSCCYTVHIQNHSAAMSTA